VGNGASVPAVALLKGHHLRTWLALPPPQLPPLVDKGLAKGTRDAHRGILRVLAAVNAELPLVPAILELLQRLALQKGWRKSTLHRYLASTQGALACLPLYRSGSATVRLAVEPAWTQAMRASALATKEEAPRQPKAATLAQAKAAVRLEPSLPVRAVLVLAWATCARVGCVLQLARQDVAMTPDGMSVTFRRGKGVRTRGPYTVHTVLSAPWRALLVRWLASRHSFLFPRSVSGVAVRSALRRVDPQLEQRSLRRGSLQHLASTGVDEETLMRFSGHTQVATLRRYLSWGLVGSNVRAAMTAAAQPLAQ
jgi:integrase